MADHLGAVHVIFLVCGVCPYTCATLRTCMCENFYDFRETRVPTRAAPPPTPPKAHMYALGKSLLTVASVT